MLLIFCEIKYSERIVLWRKHILLQKNPPQAEKLLYQLLIFFQSIQNNILGIFSNKFFVFP